MATTKTMRRDGAARGPGEDDLGLPSLRNERVYLNEPGAAHASRGQIEAWTRSFRENLQTLMRVRQDGEATQGELLHTLGTYLREFRGRSAWETLGLASWEVFCTQHLELSVRHANRLAAFAGAVTREQSRFGVRKCHAGLAIVERLGLESLSTIVLAAGAPEPTSWVRELGEPVAFVSSPANRLERLATGRRALAEPPSRRVASAVERRKAVIERMTPRHPALAELGVKSYAHGGAALVKHRPAESAEELAALAALYGALARET
jgi:hypothetical protein